MADLGDSESQQAKLGVDLDTLYAAETEVGKLLWLDQDNSHALTYYCRHVTEDGRCNPASLFINVLRRDDIKTAISLTSLDHMSIALRTACLEPGDLYISDQSGQCSPVQGDHKSMIEIRDTFRGGEDAEIETPKASLKEKRHGEGCTLPIRFGGLGKSRKLPQRGTGAEPRLKIDLVRFELNRTHLWRAKTSK